MSEVKRSGVVGVIDGTHWEGCWDGGPRHYRCLLQERTRLLVVARKAATALAVWCGDEAWTDEMEDQMRRALGSLAAVGVHPQTRDGGEG